MLLHGSDCIYFMRCSWHLILAPSHSSGRGVLFYLIFFYLWCSFLNECIWNQRSNGQHLLDYQKDKGIPEKLLLLYWLHQNLWLCGSPQTLKILKEMGIPGHLTCFLKNLYAGQEATVRTGHGTTDWFQIREGVRKGCILSPCLFNLYAEYTMWNVRLDKAQDGIKITGRNISNLRYADDTTLMAESENLKSLLMIVKEESG